MLHVNIQAHHISSPSVMGHLLWQTIILQMASRQQ